MQEIELDTKILNKNLEITRVTKQLDDLTSDYVELKEKLNQKDKSLHFLLTEVHERMYEMTEYFERLQPIKLNPINTDELDYYNKITTDLTDEKEMIETKLFRLKDIDEMTDFDDQTSRSILKDLRKVIKSLE